MTNRREDFIDADFDAPCGKIEQAVADISADVLGVDRIGRNDSFYDFGTTSLQAIRICARIEQQVDIQAQPVWVFMNDVIADFVQQIQAGGVAADD